MNNKKGFTLIELVIVIAVLGLLTTIAVPRLIGFVNMSRISVDQANVRTLNSVTPIARIKISTSDPFKDENKSNEELIELLVDEKYIESTIETQTKDAEISWLIEEEIWYLLFEDSFYEVSISDGLSIDKIGYYKGRLSGYYNGSSKDIIIPTNLDGTVVKRIWQDAFKNKDLVAINFKADSEIEQIHARAFYNNNLTNVEFPDTLEKIDLWSFRNNNLTELNFPPNLDTIEQNAFDGNDLEKITIGSDVSIGNSAFGIHTDEFITVYESSGAGTYRFDNQSEAWIKEWIIKIYFNGYTFIKNYIII